MSVIIHIGLHPLSLRDMLMIGLWHYFLDAGRYRSIVIDILAAMPHICVVRRRSLRRLNTPAGLLMANRHVALVSTATVFLTYVTHLTLISNYRGVLPTVTSSNLGFFSSYLPYRTGVVFAEIDAIFLALDVVV